jgi:hypothetical protein
MALQLEADFARSVLDSRRHLRAYRGSMRTFALLSLLTLSACGASENDSAASPTLVADAARDYSPTAQGANGWSYRTGEGANAAEMTVGADAWGDTTWCNANDRNSAFFGAEEGFLNVHPGLTTNTVLRWTVPANGQYHLEISSKKKDVGGGDGVQTRIYKNSERITAQQLAFDAGTPLTANFDWTLQLGDTVSVEVSQLSDGFYDSTALRFVASRLE